MREELARFYRSTLPRMAEVQKTLVEKELVLSKLKPMTTVPILRELKKPRETHIQIRGNFLDKGAKVEPGVPEVFGEYGQGVKNRLDLAKWLMDERNPLTARVLANRLWEKIFERGLVLTSEEFGSQGSRLRIPSCLIGWRSNSARAGGI